MPSKARHRGRSQISFSFTGCGRDTESVGSLGPSLGRFLPACLGLSYARKKKKDHADASGRLVGQEGEDDKTP